MNFQVFLNPKFYWLNLLYKSIFFKESRLIKAELISIPLPSIPSIRKFQRKFEGRSIVEGAYIYSKSVRLLFCLKLIIKK